MKSGARVMLLFLGDVVILTAAFFIMLAAAFPGRISQEIIGSHKTPFIFVSLMWILVFFLFGLYETESVKPTIPHLRRISYAALVSLSGSAVLFYVVPSFGITPKTNLVIFGFSFTLLFLVWRRIFYSIFVAYFKKGVCFVIDSEKDEVYVRELEDYIKNYPQSGLFIRGTYSSLQELFGKESARKIDTLIISRSALNGKNLKQAYDRAENILGLSYAYEDILGKVPIDSIDETWFLHNIRSGGKILYEKATRIINSLIALLTLTVTSPLLLLTALWIKLQDGGPIFYNRLRVGKGGKGFNLYKFRSMVVDADKQGSEWTEKNDPRITKVGKIIRRLHLDEVPQLLNVLRGEMALVGPRPEIPSFAEHLEQEIPHYGLRHIIAPGFTGWAQIKYRNARGIAESKEKFEYDLYYIKNRNIFMDFGIMLRTIVIIFTHN
ncbi:MAG: exopolysaccharide biosynthesis polyprenyl glycosylphosphotransferase [Patescibacteria group bacterium]